MTKSIFSSKNLFIFTVFLSLILSFQLSFASTAKEKLKKNITFGPGGYLSLSNMNGEVDIVSWDKDEVEIIAYKEVKANDRSTAEQLMKRLEIDIRESDDEITIETYFPKGSSGRGFFGWLFGGGHNSYSVEYEIKVPKKIDLNIHTTNGSLRIEQISGRLRLESTNGKIIAREISGVTRCKTTNGSINVDFSEITTQEKLTFKTTNGSIKLYLPEDFAAEVELKTTNGHIDSDFPLRGGSKKSKKRFSGYINNDDRKLTCTTTNGSIHLYVND